MMRPLLKLLLVLCIAPATYSQAILTNNLSVLRLTPEQARENRPVRVRGVVTMYVPGSQLCFVQDQSAGIYVQPSPWPKELVVGEVVEVTGQTGEGRFSPIIHMGVIKRTGEKRTIAPRRVSLGELNTGRVDCQYIEVEAVLRKVVIGNAVELELTSGGNIATGLIFSGANAPTNAIDSQVRLRGVAGTLYAGDRLSGFAVFLSDASFLEVVRPGSDPFVKPIRVSNKLVWYTPDGMMDHRVRVRGTVTLSWPGESFFIQDAGGGLRVQPVHQTRMPQPGEVVEVAGFVSNAMGPAPALDNALWRRVGSTNVPAHRSAHVPDLLLAQPSGQLVAVEGEVKSIFDYESGSVALLQEEGKIVRAFSREKLPPDLNFSLVRLSGVLSTPPGSIKNSAEPSLWVSGDKGVAVLKKASAEPPQSGTDYRVIAATAAIAAALILGAMLWASQKNSAKANAVVHATTEEVGNLQKEVAQLREGRERLGRDLHDHIIQSIYAVGLNLEDSRQTLADPAKTESRIKSALGEINDVIRELRNVILGLETNTIQPQEFRTALKSLALTLGHTTSSRIRLDVDQDALDALSPAQATELIHIAREAMSNSIRHGQAETTTLSLHRHQDWLRFTVEDDGKGFNPQGTEPGGFGLRNMAKRSEGLGAKFTISAQEGLGTRIVLDIPRQKQHFSSSEPRSIANR